MKIQLIKLVHSDAMPEYTEVIPCDPDCPITFIKKLIEVYDSEDITISDIDLEDFLGAHDVAPKDIHNEWSTVDDFVIEVLDYFNYLVSSDTVEIKV